MSAWVEDMYDYFLANDEEASPRSKPLDWHAADTVEDGDLLDEIEREVNYNEFDRKE